MHTHFPPAPAGSVACRVPGWGMGDSGVYGPNVEQIKCEGCYSDA